MKNSTREKFDLMCSAIAQQYGVQNVARTFAATPQIEQRLMDKVVESSAFLQKINVQGVRDLEGEKIFGSAAGVIGKRTDTSNNERATSRALTLDDNRYRLYKTEYDYSIGYQTLDAWAKFPDLYNRYSEYIRKAMALSRIKIGFYGKSAEDATDPVANPNGEDVNIGWFQHLRDYNGGAQLLSQGAIGGTIRLGPGGDYENLDSMVHDILQLIDPVHRDGGDLVAIIGRDLLATDKAQLYTAQGQKPTEKERIENSAVTRTYGGLPADMVPNFPPRGLMITSYDNLSLYYQEEHVRQQIVDNAKRDQIEHYHTANDGYVIEDHGKAAGAEPENVLIFDGSDFV